MYDPLAKLINIVDKCIFQRTQLWLLGLSVSLRTTPGRRRHVARGEQEPRWHGGRPGGDIGLHFEEIY